MKNEIVEESHHYMESDKKTYRRKKYGVEKLLRIKYRIKLLNFVKYAIIHFRLFKNNLNGGEVMNIQEFYDSIDESYENVSSRMMGNQKLVEKFVRKFLDDPTYEQIKEAVDKMDYDEILRTTHTMKGIASNLEFTHLQQKSAKAVDMIRAGQREEVLPVIGEIEKEYQKVIEQIQKLD